MANEQNLKPYKTGDEWTGNDKGRPPGSKNRSTLFRRWLDVSAQIVNPETAHAEEGTLEDKIAVKVIAAALKGDLRAAQEIFDSTYGKVTQPMEHTGKNGGPLVFLSADRLSDEQIEKLINQDAGGNDESL